MRCHVLKGAMLDDALVNIALASSENSPDHSFVTMLNLKECRAAQA
jgi:hypothetical protein